jgi:MFS family permease
VTAPSRSAARRIATARLVSLTGSQAAFTALVVAVYARTNDAGWISAVLLVGFWTAGVLTPFAGSLGDRFDRRRVMICSDLAGAVAFASFAFARSPWALLVLAFLDAAAASPFLPAASASVPNLVGEEDLAWANGTIAFGSNVGYLAGPAIGGLLAATVGPTAAFLANAASYLVSAALVTSVRGRFSSEPAEARAAAERPAGVLSGFAFIFGDRVLRTMAFAFLTFAVAVGSVLVAELPLAQAFDAGSFGYGLLSAAFGVGALAGALAGRRMTPAAEPRVLVIGSLVTGAAFAAVAFAPAFAFVLVAMLVAGGSDGIVDVAIELVFQRRSPDRIRSRVLGAMEAVFLLGLAVSFLFAGALVGTFGPDASYLLAGAGCVLCSGLLLPLLRPSFGLRAQTRR